VLNDPFEEGVGEKPWEKKSRAEQSRAEQSLVLLLFTRKWVKRLLPILTLGFLLGEILPKWAFFFFFFFFLVESGDLQKCFPVFLVTIFQKRNLFSNIL
jgi:hypothetical protein